METPNADIYLTVEEAAAILRVDRKTVLKAVGQRTLPALRLGRAIRIHRDAIVTYTAPPRSHR